MYNCIILFYIKTTTAKNENTINTNVLNTRVSTGAINLKNNNIETIGLDLGAYTMGGVWIQPLIFRQIINRVFIK